MRPIRLSITGLHSFREKQEIDFTALTDTGMFGIFGPTGSGKSTILDALTLALYGDVSRAEHSTQAILNHGEKRLQVSFEFEIGGAFQRKRYLVERMYKRADGFSVLHQSSRLLELEPPAMLENTANLVLSAERDGHSSRLQADVAGEGKAAEFGQVVLADSKNAVNQKIRDILGLEQSDFTRAVVLPQGKFAEFLQLTGSERNRMTERLFGLEQYGQSLVDKVKGRLDGAQQERATVTAAQQELGDASREAMVTAEETVAQAKSALLQAAVELAQARENHAQAKQVWDLQTQRTQAQAAQADHGKQADEIEQVRHTLAMAERARRVWPLVLTTQGAQVDLERYLAEYDHGVAHEAEMRATLVTTQDQWRDLQERQAAEEPVLLQRQGLLQDGLGQEQELRQRQEAWEQVQVAYHQAVAKRDEAKQALAEVDRSMESLTAEIEQTQQELDEHTLGPVDRQQLLALHQSATTWERLRQAEQKAQENLAGRAENLAAARVTLARAVESRNEFTMRQEQTRRQMEKIRILPPGLNLDFALWDSWLAGLRPQVQTLQEAERVVEKAQLAAEGLATVFQQCEGVAITERDVANRALVALTDLRRRREEQIHQDELGMASRLAAHLQDGIPCPVCGSEHHPHPALVYADAGIGIARGRTWDEWSADMMEAEKAWRTAEDVARQAEDKQVRAEATLTAAWEEVRQRQAEIGEAQDRLAAAWQGGLTIGLMEFLQATVPTTLVARRDKARDLMEWDGTSVPNSGRTWSGALGHMEVEVARLRDLWQRWQRQLDGLEEEWTSLMQPLQEAAQEVTRAEQRVQSADLEVQAQMQGVEQLKQDVAMAARQMQANLAAAGMVCIHLEQEGMDVVQQRMKRMEEDDLRAEDAKIRLTGLRQSLINQQVALAAANEHFQKWELSVKENVTRGEQLAEEVKERQRRLIHLTGGKTVADAATAVESDLAALHEAILQAVSAVQTADRNVHEATEKRAKAEAELQSARRQFEQSHQRLQAALADERFVTVGEVADARMDEAKWQEQSTRVKEYEAMGVRLRAVYDGLTHQLAGRTVDETQWLAVQSQLSMAQIDHETALEAHGFANSRLQDIQVRHARWQELEVQRQELEHQTGHLEALRNLLRGNSFVEFMAREQMNGVARQASERLQTLTRGRYALKLTEDGGFLMRDDHNGGVTRPVSTLSGGETFLTSLALALSLSAHIQLRGRYPLEFFFLDEGFGSLDPDSLDVVVTTLEKLHLERMSIGIISHVPELRQRLQRRLIVEPAEPAGRGTRVWLERA